MADIDGPDSGGTLPLSVRDVIAAHHTGLLRFLRQRLRFADHAPDVAQEAYIRLLQYEGSREVKSPSSLLFRIAINVANDLGRAEQVRRVGDQCEFDEMDMATESSTSPERELAAQQDLARLHEAIEALPPKCRRVFVLSRFHDMSYPQIAAHCGISVKMVEKHVSHALAVCAEKMR